MTEKCAREIVGIATEIAALEVEKRRMTTEIDVRIRELQERLLALASGGARDDERPANAVADSGHVLLTPALLETAELFPLGEPMAFSRIIHHFAVDRTADRFALANRIRQRVAVLVRMGVLSAAGIRGKYVRVREIAAGRRSSRSPADEG